MRARVRVRAPVLIRFDSIATKKLSHPVSIRVCFWGLTSRDVIVTHFRNSGDCFNPPCRWKINQYCDSSFR